MDIKLDRTKNFAIFLRQSFAEFMKKEIESGKKIPSQNDFAKWLGVKSTSVSSWITEARPPAGENIDILASKLGLKVYDILGKPEKLPDDERIKLIASRWHLLSEEQKNEILNLVEKMTS